MSGSWLMPPPAHSQCVPSRASSFKQQGATGLWTPSGRLNTTARSALGAGKRPPQKSRATSHFASDLPPKYPRRFRISKQMHFATKARLRSLVAKILGRCAMPTRGEIWFSSPSDQAWQSWSDTLRPAQNPETLTFQCPITSSSLRSEKWRAFGPRLDL